MDESTPALAHLALWACAGALMAHALALLSWQAVRRLPGAAPGRS